jgi:hypothetical protein
MLFINKLFSEKMKLYNKCLAFTLLNEGYETDDLPHTIQEDIAVLTCFKNQLHDWSEQFELSTIIQEKITYDYYYRNCACSIDIDCECEPFNDYQVRPGCEEELQKLLQEEVDLKMKLDKLEIDMKDVVPSRLRDVAVRIANKVDYQWLSFLNIDYIFN